jgi:hypothetical protein
MRFDMATILAFGDRARSPRLRRILKRPNLYYLARTPSLPNVPGEKVAKCVLSAHKEPKTRPSEKVDPSSDFSQIRSLSSLLSAKSYEPRAKSQQHVYNRAGLHQKDQLLN